LTGGIARSTLNALTIRVNGDPLELPGPLTVADLLDRLNIDGRRVAVEHNLVVLKRHAFATTQIADGDEIEIVNFVGGGGQTVRGSGLRGSGFWF
jgi:thiamine biosynthesis protein ThiS